MSEKTKITVTYELTEEQYLQLQRQTAWFNRIFGENMNVNDYFDWIMEAETGFKFNFDCAIRRMDRLLKAMPRERSVIN